MILKQKVQLFDDEEFFLKAEFQNKESDVYNGFIITSEMKEYLKNYELYTCSWWSYKLF